MIINLTNVTVLRALTQGIFMCMLLILSPLQAIGEVPASAKRPYFGDLHVHSSWSLDSYVLLNRAGPDAAFRFAKGEVISLYGGRTYQIAIPLDFMALTEHAQYLGDLDLCLNQDSAAFLDPLCYLIRNKEGTADKASEAFRKVIVANALSSRPDHLASCPDNAACLSAARTVWQRLQALADLYNEPGHFTTLHAWEWTSNLGGVNRHRNVIFRNNHVTNEAISSYEARDIWTLWRRLKTECKAPCDVLTISHNSNQSRGTRFGTSGPGGSPMTAAEARFQTGMEPLVEVMQAKGESMCRPGVGTEDEYCGFEKTDKRRVCNAGETGGSCVPVCGPEDKPGTRECVFASNYVRNALKVGMVMEQAIGVNPFQLGFVGGTDTHNAIAGGTREKNYPGHHGIEDGTAEARRSVPVTKIITPPLLKNPGALTGVWAEQNTREAIFDALRRKETFATSGTRIAVRLDATIGGRKLPMGSVIDSAQSLRFEFQAVKAADGAGLDRVQIVKGWVEDGEQKERVLDVLCSGGRSADPKTRRCPDTNAGVDLKTCANVGNKGAVELSGAWEDPDFDPGLSSFYYIRVLEMPSCRWSTWESIATDQVPPSLVPPVIQERAWSSPIWYTPKQ